MKLDLKTMGYISVFEKYTGSNVKDCFLSGSSLVFIVKEGQIGRAIGKKGINIKNLSKKFKKSLRVIEFSDDAVKFVKNLIYPVKTHVEKRGNKIVISAEDTKTKGFLFGRDKSKLKDMQEIIKRYFDIEISIE
jgi:N utilization substance protein A